MKRAIACLILATTLAAIPLTLTTGCAVTSGRESAREYAKDKEITTRIKTAMYADPSVKGTEINVTTLRGVVQLSGFVDNASAKQRAVQIASSTPGVAQVYDNIVVGATPTGR